MKKFLSDTKNSIECWRRNRSINRRFAAGIAGDHHLFLTIDHGIPRSQIDGFRFSCEEAGMIMYSVDYSNFNINKLPKKLQPKVIWIQTFWSEPEAAVAKKIEALREKYEGIPIVYLDWFAPAHLPCAYAFRLCDFYVKKNILVDRSYYENPQGDTNLSEYEAQWNKDLIGRLHPIPDKDDIHKKLIVGWSFATDERLVGLLRKKLHRDGNRPIDLHCRIAAPKKITGWYDNMRTRSLKAAQAVESGNVLTSAVRLSWDDYMAELMESKLCLSPFGYGEVCWRDFEAIACGAMLIKPDMSHLETSPNLFVPYETYVPINWDFSDLIEKVDTYLADGEARKRIAENAHATWLNYIDNELSGECEKLVELIVAPDS